MRKGKAKIDRASIEQRNREHKSLIAHYKRLVERVTTDMFRKKRLEAQECVICFGGSRIGGAACTSWACAFCGKESWGGNTNTDVLCHECAKKAGLCKHCGADIDLKNRRKRELPVAEQSEGVVAE